MIVDENFAQLATWQFSGFDMIEILQMPEFETFKFQGKTMYELMKDFGLGGLTGRF